MGVSAVLFAAGMLADTRLEAFLPSWLVLTLCYVLPYALCGYDVLRQMLRNIMRGDIFNEFTLMGGATIAAIALGQLPEAVGVMLFYRIGEFMQERAAGNSRRSVKALLAARPTTAHELLDDGATRDVSPEDLGPGSRILVRPGEKIPLDGTVLEGESQVDASPLTGESVPVRLSPGGQVHAGTINLNGALTVEVTAPFAESSIARILEMVENAAARKAPTERFITRLARWYTPAVSGLALLVAVLPPLFGLGSFQEWIYRALVLLVISCPCALLISIPLGYFGGIGAASRRGILIKGGAVLDNLRDIRVAAFDKTGTLTEGVFEVNAVLPMPGVSREELLSVAALAESRSNHPIARSVLRAALAAGLGTEKDAAVSAMREIPGKGVEVTADGAQVLAGNAALLEAYNITPLPVDMPGSVVQVARDGRALGALVVSDRIKPQAPGALEALRRLGVDVLAMLTGDRQSQARPVAKELGLDVLKADLLPEDKASALEALGPTRQTLMVGDGINDAPVLATAGVGVAMGGLGSEAAIETADVVILDDNPLRLPELLRIARRTRRIVWENIVLALGIKGLFMGLGIVGLSGLWEAVFADVGVALLAVLNASRAGRI
ncbi:heavy metal translocating P-type ATPase [Desulfovibrionaceae bacterium]|nr:heavy metal translocating P-type ATPase [Desulfovibrionaceae bacterium]